MKALVLSLVAICLSVFCPMVAQDRSAQFVDQADDLTADCLQYLPLAFPEIMKICGQPTRSDWGRLAVSQACSAVLIAGTVYTLKHFVDSRRPDRSDYDSFPSGHSALAFTGATVVAKEFGWRSPWYSVGAYAFATGIAVERIVERRHSAIDVVSGALLGVAMTELGYFLTDKIYRERGLGEKYRLSLRPAAVTAASPFGQRQNGLSALSPGLIVSLEF